uniref:AAA family ATPase n=1 Tax=Rhizobium sp. F40D2 TaxID=3453141 RepID=UPI003F22C85A
MAAPPKFDRRLACPVIRHASLLSAERLARTKEPYDMSWRRAGPVLNEKRLRGFNVCHAKEQIDKACQPPFLKRLWVKEDAKAWASSIRSTCPWLDTDFLLDFATPVTIIVGENGTGKSTLIGCGSLVRL